MKIKIKSMKMEEVKVEHLKPMQGGLKYLTEKNYEKLKKSFEDKGMFVPMIVWQKREDEFMIMDGHGRERLFTKEGAQFVDEAGKPTDSIPCIIIHADNEKDAKEKLLIITSQFQKITQEGLDEFAFDLDDDWLKAHTNFDAIFDFEVVNDPDEEYKGMPAYESEDAGAYRDIIVHFKDQKAVDEFAKMTKQNITEKTKFIWYPEIEIDHAKDEHYVEDEEPQA
jgi:hypothetical protein